MDFFLDINRHGRDSQRIFILFVLAFPDKLLVKGWIASIKQSGEFNFFRLLFLLADKVAQLLGGNVLALVLVLERFNPQRFAAL